MKRSLQDRTAIVGVGNTPFGALYRNLDPERSPYDLGADAFVEALADSGLSKSDVDGVLVCRVPDYGRMCEVLGIRYPRFVNLMQATTSAMPASMASAAYCTVMLAMRPPACMRLTKRG